MVDFSNIDSSDVKSIKEFMECFGLEAPPSLRNALDNLELEESNENKNNVVIELLAYLSTQNLADIDEIFEPVQVAINEANESLKNGDE